MKHRHTLLGAPTALLGRWVWQDAAMPEGDTVWRVAHNLRPILVGHTLTRCDIRVPRYAHVNLTGQQVQSVEPRGKHLFIRVGGTTIHSHLKMEGIWHIYPAGARWSKPGWQARAVLRTREHEVVGFNLGMLEVLRTAEEDAATAHLGPDLLGPDWDAAEAVRRLTRDPARPVGLALLDQHNLAGVGNIYRNELCFLQRVHPQSPMSAVSDPQALVALAHRLLELNKERVDRYTTGDPNPGRRLWVYGRARRPCFRCGATIVTSEFGEREQGDRVIFVCPRCQPR